MQTRRAIGVIASLLCVALVSGALVTTPAHAGKSCKPFKPKAPQSPSAEKDEALDAKVIKLTDKATEKKPVTVEFSQGPGVWLDAENALVENSEFFNFQVVSKAAMVELNLHVQWPTPSASDIDEYLFDAKGVQVAESNAFNPFPPLNQSTGGEGFEHISFPARRCDGFTLESRPFISPGEPSVTIHAWLN
jgi:hypothetical protein